MAPVGRLGLATAATGTVESRAGATLASLVKGFALPEAGAFRLRLTGENIAEIKIENNGDRVDTLVVSRFDYDRSWDRLSDYEAERPALFPGAYRATVEYGDSAAVGYNAPYFRGEGGGRVSIGETTRCTVVAKVCNALVRVATTANFDDYFTQPQFRLVVDGEPTDFVLTGSDSEPVFVPAGAQIAWQGAVRRPAQTSADAAAGEIYTFELAARTAAAGTVHTFTFTAEAGGATVGVRFEEFAAGDTEGHEPEMNEDALPPETDAADDNE